METEGRPDSNSPPFSIDFDSEAYVRKRDGEIRPRKTFEPKACTPQTIDAVNRGLLELAGRSVIDGFPNPHTRAFSPGGAYGSLWDWDSYLAGLSIYPNLTDVWHDSCLIFLGAIQSDGRPAMSVTRTGDPVFDGTPLPLHAQWVWSISMRRGDAAWIEPYWDRLVSVRRWYRANRGGRRGLYVLTSRGGMAIDNDPVAYLKANANLGAVHTNVFHYREHRAMALIAQAIGRNTAAQNYQQEADELALAINTFMFDEIDGFYYHVDLHDHGRLANQGATWEVPFKIKGCAGLFPIWAGIAPEDHARRAIEEHVLNPHEFLAPGGIRSLARNERMYNNCLMGNPSNWQGPVWGVSTVFAAYGLARYGYLRDALEIANRFVGVIAGDLETNHTAHECYNGDSSQPIMKPEFASFNLLAFDLHESLQKGEDIFALQPIE